jgi:thiol-disulfide isomerase/thioredoxin
MKNKIVWIIVAVLLICNIGLVVHLLTKDDAKVVDNNHISTSCDADRFKSEYEALNNKDNGYGGKYLEISVPTENQIEYVNSTRVKQVLTNGTGVIYFGFPECPWCRNITPTLLDVANEFDMPILYINNKEERDTIKLDESGNVKIEKEGSKDYYEILELLGDNASVYDGLNDETIKRIYFPTVVFVKDGEIVGIHEGTVDSQEDASIYLTVEQQKELKTTLKSFFEKIKPGKCSADSPAC